MPKKATKKGKAKADQADESLRPSAAVFDSKGADPLPEAQSGDAAIKPVIIEPREEVDTETPLARSNSKRKREGEDVDVSVIRRKSTRGKVPEPKEPSDVKDVTSKPKIAKDKPRKVKAIALTDDLPLDKLKEEDRDQSTRTRRPNPYKTEMAHDPKGVHLE